MELPVLKIDGTPSGKKVVLDEKVFGIEPNDHAIYLDVVQYLANQRQGTAKTKDRSEIAHSTKKLGRQKGGGGARHGSLKANIFVGGGRVFGPKPRLYRTKLNKKVKRLALKSALSAKAAENEIVVVDGLKMDEIKTKTFKTFLDKIGAVLLATLAWPQFASGQEEAARASLRSAKELAAFFDAAPSYDESDIRFIGRIKGASAHDDMGATAMEAVHHAVSELEDEAFSALWSRIVEEK